MLVSQAKWNFIEQEENESFERSLHVSPIVEDLLLQRGIGTADAAEQFLRPKLNQLVCPSKFCDIEKAAMRVQKAIENNEKILVLGDYDADGVTSTALLMIGLQRLGAKCEFYIPNRFTEGYGLNEAQIIKAHEDGYQLLITVDNGIASVSEARVAKELGIDLIITDHHEIQEELPEAFAIIHPKYSPDYPFKELAGVGVTFKFVEYLLGHQPEDLLDLVAIGTIADLVPLIGENRVLAKYGLERLSNTDNIGLQALKKVCRLEGMVSEDDVGFLIAPRLNAVGRLQEASLAVDLLLTKDEQEATELAEKIQSINKERQTIVNEIVKEAEEMVDPDDGVIILKNEHWHEGVLGIVASRIVQKYDRPAIILTIKIETNELKGSARSIPAFDLFNNCMKIKHLFTTFGGHAQAAGMSFPLENLSQIKSRLNELIFDQLTKDDFRQVINISKTIEITEIDEQLINEIDHLAPFGMNNPKPIFHIKYRPATIRQIGSMKNHLKMQFKSDDKLIEAIGFQKGELYYHISPNTPVSIVGELNLNEWNGIRTPQVMIEDLSINEWQLFDYRGRKKRFDIKPYLSYYDRHIILSQEPVQFEETYPNQVVNLTYDVDYLTLTETDMLHIYDLPKNLTQLQKIIQLTNPNSVLVSYGVEQSTYLDFFPKRDEFKRLYAYIFKYKKLTREQLFSLANHEGWVNEHIVFMTKVFLELEFITFNNGLMMMNDEARKRDLRESELYRERLQQREIERILYYSTYDELKSWIASSMNYKEVAEEEIVYGL